MRPDPSILPPSGPPDLEEFLSALGGFLDKQSSPSDPSYLRFLSMFCRSIGATEGHFLKVSEVGQLASITAFGLPDTWNKEFNDAHFSGNGEACPLDDAFTKKEVMAVVDLRKDPSIPKWFSGLMEKNKFRSLVAVPLIGHDNPVGILCGYYHDVCLFDQNTLDHLMMIGRMVGAATEKSMGADRAVSLGALEEISDQFLKLLTLKPQNKAKIFESLSAMAGTAFKLKGMITGPIRKDGNTVSMTVAAGKGIPSKIISTRVELPVFVVHRLSESEGRLIMEPVNKNEWGEMKSLVGLDVAKPIALPLLYQKKLMGAFLGWMPPETHFTQDSERLLMRLTNLASLGLALSD